VSPLAIRALDLADAGDVTLGRELVEEYVEFTATEAHEYGMYDIDMAALRTVIPDLVDFTGRYRDGRFLAAHAGERVAGGVGITRVDGRLCEMNRLWLRDGHRGGGNGRVLVAACLDHARELGFARMVLDVAPYRDRALALYHSFGFVDAPPMHDYPFPMVALARDL
jgi:GNAT superfamily N-acetyltransferase